MTTSIIERLRRQRKKERKVSLTFKLRMMLRRPAYFFRSRYKSLISCVFSCSICRDVRAVYSNHKQKKEKEIGSITYVLAVSWGGTSGEFPLDCTARPSVPSLLLFFPRRNKFRWTSSVMLWPRRYLLFKYIKAGAIHTFKSVQSLSSLFIFFR